MIKGVTNFPKRSRREPYAKKTKADPRDNATAATTKVEACPIRRVAAAVLAEAVLTGELSCPAPVVEVGEEVVVVVVVEAGTSLREVN